LYGTLIDYQSSYYTEYYYGELSVAFHFGRRVSDERRLGFRTGLGTVNAVNLFNNWSQISSAVKAGATKSVDPVRSIGGQF
jgi:hypothetical protein